MSRTPGPDTRPGVEQHGALAAHDQVAVVLLVVARLPDREGPLVELLHREVVVEPADRRALVRLLEEGRRARQGEGMGKDPVTLRDRDPHEPDDCDPHDHLLHAGLPPGAAGARSTT
jgi:hypothetical protein